MVHSLGARGPDNVVGDARLSAPYCGTIRSSEPPTASAHGQFVQDVLRQDNKGMTISSYDAENVPVMRGPLVPSVRPQPSGCRRQVRRKRTAPLGRDDVGNRLSSIFREIGCSDGWSTGGLPDERPDRPNDAVQPRALDMSITLDGAKPLDAQADTESAMTFNTEFTL